MVIARDRRGAGHARVAMRRQQRRRIDLELAGGIGGKVAGGVRPNDTMSNRTQDAAHLRLARHRDTDKIEQQFA